MYSIYYCVRPDTLKMDQLFNYSSNAKLIKLCKFVQEILNSFKLKVDLPATLFENTIEFNLIHVYFLRRCIYNYDILVWALRINSARRCRGFK